MPEIGEIKEREDGSKWVFKENRRWGKVVETIPEPVEEKEKEYPQLTPKQWKVLQARRKNKLRKRWDGLDTNAHSINDVMQRFDRTFRPMQVEDDSANDIYIRRK